MSNIDALGMSDEDFLNQSPTSFDMPEEQPEAASTVEPVELIEPIEQVIENDQPTDEVTEEEPEFPEVREDDEPQEAGHEETSTDEPEEKTAESEETASMDYEGEYNKILAPFKANGMDMQVKSPEEAIQLMQMGANYTKKMQGLQPNLKLLKMLEKNELLDESKLNMLINISEGNPEAISKFIKDKGIELDDFDDESKEFKPRDYTVNEAEMKVAEVLSTIENTPTYARTIDVVGNKWDSSSKQTLSEKPEIIATINEHMSNGIFDKVNGEVQRQKTFGGLTGLSDYDAYMTVGNQIHQAGGFNEAPKPVASTPIPAKSKDDTARTQKRKAASSTKAAPVKTQKEEFNPLSLSDEEFSKLLNTNL